MTLSRRAFVPYLTVAALSSKLPIFAAGEKVKQVSGQFVCMINKRHFPKMQTLVLVDGKPYYSCCDMCTEQLKNNPESRKDIDPLSGKTVDKATAWVGVDKAGNVYFFEDGENLKKFRVPEKAGN